MSNTDQAPTAALASLDFSQWHPLAEEWHVELVPELQAIVQRAQKSLADNNRTDAELAAGLEQLAAWRQSNPELVDSRAPDVVAEEKLGSLLVPQKFIAHLLQQPSLALKSYEFAALALLKEAAGLADLEAVAKKDALSPVSQHFTAKIMALHAGVILLRLAERPEFRKTAEGIILALF